MQRKPIGYTYFVRLPLGDGFIKVGFSAGHPDRRLADLQTASPVPLERVGFIFGTASRERRVHGIFQALRSSGEWFRAEPRLLAYIGRYAAPWHPLSPAHPDETAWLREEFTAKLRARNLARAERIAARRVLVEAGAKIAIRDANAGFDRTARREAGVRGDLAILQVLKMERREAAYRSA